MTNEGKWVDVGADGNFYWNEAESTCKSLTSMASVWAVLGLLCVMISAAALLETNGALAFGVAVGGIVTIVTTYLLIKAAALALKYLSVIADNTDT